MTRACNYIQKNIVENIFCYAWQCCNYTLLTLNVLFYIHTYICACVLYILCVDRRGARGKKKKKVNLSCNQWEKTELFLLKRASSALLYKKRYTCQLNILSIFAIFLACVYLIVVSRHLFSFHYKQIFKIFEIIFRVEIPSTSIY